MSQFPQADKSQLQEDASDSKSFDGDGNNLEKTGDGDAEVHAAAGFCRPGEIVGRHFEVISVLGGGGQSVVYKARHQVLDRAYAVKVMLPDRVLNDKNVRRFQQEAKAVSKLDHPSIVKVHEFDLDESGQPYIVMDYVEGRPLSSIIRESACLHESKAIALVAQAVDALSLAHAKGVVHRDLKPSNLIVVTDDAGAQTISLVDFGIAKVTMPDEKNHTLTSTGEVIGSPLYMSPEQCLGKPIDLRTDVYSLGCVLHECLTGKPPFQSASFLETLMAHVQQPLQITDNRISDSLKSILQRCLAKDPAARYQSMVDLKADLQKAAKGLPVEYLLPESSPSATNVDTQLPESEAAKHSQPNIYSNLQKAFPLLLICFVCLIAWAGSELIKSNSSGGGASADSFALDNKVPPHRSDPITFWSNDYQKADRYDDDTMQLFTQGQYQKAIDDLKFCINTYRENGTHYGNPDIETAFRGEAYYHLSRCYSATGQKQEAAASLREAVRLLGKIKLSDKSTSDAISEYAHLLRTSGKDSEALKMLEDFQFSGRITHVPEL